MIKEFKEFISKGNVVDLAVAVIIGAAFGAIVKSFSTDILGQLLAAIGAVAAVSMAVKASRTLSARRSSPDSSPSSLRSSGVSAASASSAVAPSSTFCACSTISA